MNSHIKKKLKVPLALLIMFGSLFCIMNLSFSDEPPPQDNGGNNCPDGVDHDLEVLPPNVGELCPGDPVPDGTFACCCGETGDASPTPTTAPTTDGALAVRWNATCNGVSDHVDGSITVNSQKRQDFQTPNTPVVDCYYAGSINGGDGQISVYQRYTGTMYVRTCTGAAFYDPAPTLIGAAHPLADCPY